MCIFISIYFYISIHLSIHPFDLFSVTLLKVFCTTNLEPTVVSTTRVERAKMGQPARPQFGESQKVPKTVDAFTKGYTPQELENQQSQDVQNYSTYTGEQCIECSLFCRCTTGQY